MSGKLIGIIIAALIVVAGGAAYVITKDKDDNKASVTVASKTGAQTEKNDTTINANLLSITSSGKARKCTFQSTVNNVTSNGTLFTDGKGRGLMEIVIPDVGSTNVLALSDKVYGWTNAGGSTSGFTYSKAELEKMSSSAGVDSQAKSTASSANKDFAMTCSSWSVDLAKLNVPTSINFVNIPSGQ